MATQDDYALQLQQQAQAQVASQKKKNEGGDNGSKKNPLKLNTPATDTSTNGSKKNPLKLNTPATDTSTKHDINTPPPAPPGTVLDDTNGKGYQDDSGFKPKPHDGGGGGKGYQDDSGFKPKHHDGGGGGKTDTGTDLTITPGAPNPKTGQMNIVDYASNLITNPSLGFTGDNPNTKTNESMMLSDRLDSKGDIKDMTQAGLINGSANKYKMNPTKYSVDPKEVKNVKEKNAKGYNVATSQKGVAQQDMTAAQGDASNSLIDPSQVPQVDTKGIATGVNADGTINEVGKALSKYAAVDMSNIIDTSTVSGKLLAQQLGDGNYVDSKATLQGQLEILQNQFVDPTTGEPKIPSWAAATARNVSKIAAFKGMSGTAATAAMSQALLEASIPIAQADSQFFQTLTLQNLDNRQQSVINTANTLAKFEQTNVDNRMAAAIQNSKNLLDMDMSNLSNEQQSRVINNAARVQSILEDTKAQNAERLFTAQDQTDRDKFYDSLNTQIKQYNSSQNLDAQKFNATMADSRDKFEKEMQYNIDIANAKWRQEVQLQEDQQEFEAQTTDVKNMTDLSVNQLNQVWDRSDALLDYAWKSSESDIDRRNQLAIVSLQGDNQMNSSMMQSLGLLAGSFVGSSTFSNLIGKLF